MSTCVFFFGGFGASDEDMERWRVSAKEQRSDVVFGVYPWPKGVVSSPDTEVVKGARNAGLFNKALKAIQSSPASLIYIVGHSSGCAIANAVDNAFTGNSKNGNTSKVALIALDGFTPDTDQRGREKTQVWGAMSGKQPSKNFPKWVAKHHVHQAPANCKTLWALHFSVVNTAANDTDIPNIPNGWKNGYKNCVANLAWLK